jgi:hypothetical protein
MTCCYELAAVAQYDLEGNHNPCVVGSSPAAATSLFIPP